MGSRVYEDLDCDRFRALTGMNHDIDGFVATFARFRETAKAKAALEESPPIPVLLRGILLGLEATVMPDIAAICRIDMTQQP